MKLKCPACGKIVEPGWIFDSVDTTPKMMTEKEFVDRIVNTHDLNYGGRTLCGKTGKIVKMRRVK